MQKVMSISLRFHIASPQRWQGEGIGVGERNKARCWGGCHGKKRWWQVGGPGERERSKETRRGKNRQGTESEYNKFEVKPVGSKVSTPCCLGILGKLQNHYPRRVCFSLYMCHEVRIWHDMPSPIEWNLDIDWWCKKQRPTLFNTPRNKIFLPPQNKTKALWLFSCLPSTQWGLKGRIPSSGESREERCRHHTVDYSPEKHGICHSRSRVAQQLFHCSRRYNSNGTDWRACPITPDWSRERAHAHLPGWMQPCLLLGMAGHAWIRLYMLSNLLAFSNH